MTPLAAPRSARLAATLVTLCVWLHGLPCHAEVRPATCFGPHMVLQREMPLPVWGKATPGETVTVAFGAVKATAVADSLGDWHAALPALPASAVSRTLEFRGSNRVAFADVLVGEVWLCAGQSNMLLPLASCNDAARETAAASRPLLRLLAMRPAATGDPPPYTADQVRRLMPDEFCTGEWSVCSPAAARDFSAVGYFLGARLAEALDVPVGIVCVAVGGTPTEAWVRRAAMAGDPALAALVDGDWMRNPALGGWCVDRATAQFVRARRAAEPVPGDDLGPNHPFKPGFMWEAGIAPLVPLAIRGIAWYQGESNAESPRRVDQHGTLFPALVRDWRRQWDRTDLPFVFVQLPGMNRPDWPAFRETQRLTLAAVPRTGMVVTIDLGKKSDVHPRDKRPVGERIGAWALAEVYRTPDTVGSGPLPAAVDFRDDGTIVIGFDHAEAGLRTSDGRPPRHFEIAGVDGVFCAAATRIDRGRVVVEPVAGTSPARQVRYAWMPFPEPPVNLVNAAGFPASPFLLSRDGRPAE